MFGAGDAIYDKIIDKNHLLNFVQFSVIIWTPNLVCHLLPSAPKCQSFPRPYTTISPFGLTFAEQMGNPPQFKDLILFFASQSQKCMPPSDPAVMNHRSLMGLKLTELIGQRIVFPPSSCLLLLKVITDFQIKRFVTGVNCPFTFLFMVERLARPSKEAMPNMEVFWFIAIDWIWEYFPKSTDSTTDREPWLLTSIIRILSFAVPATSIGNWKSLVKTLFQALTVITGFGFPTCQK